MYNYTYTNGYNKTNFLLLDKKIKEIKKPVTYICTLLSIILYYTIIIYKNNAYKHPLRFKKICVNYSISRCNFVKYY